MASGSTVAERSEKLWLLLAVGCFFLTGMFSLVYEVCWIRKASLAFGSATWALSAVLAVFFAGLALGSYVLGVYSSRVARPLRVYGWLEVGVALAAIASPTLFQWTDRVYGAIYPHVFHSVPLLTATRLALITVIILPATTLMGGSLPLFCRQFVRRSGQVTRGVGWLYGLNTLGAAGGGAVGGFWLIPHVGIDSSIYLAGLLNLAVGLSALRISGRLSAGVGPVPIDSQSAREPGGPVSSPSVAATRSPRVLMILFFGVGFVALANEVLWTRYLSLWMPNTVYTYTLTLTVVLLGIVLGSLVSAAISRRVRRPLAWFGAAQVACGLSVMLAMQLRPAWWGEWLTPVSVPEQLTVIVLVMLIPAVLSGLSFPLAVGLLVRDADEAASAAGRLAAVNIVGGIVGSLLTGFVLLPLSGIQTSLFVITAVSLSIGIVAWWSLGQQSARYLRAGWTLVSLLLWGAIPYYCDTQLPQDFLATDAELVDFREGITDNVAVVRQGDTLQLEVNRMWQGQDRKNHQIMAAHIPALLHGDPKRVLVIGLGTGQTAGSFLAYDVERLDCLEIEDGMVDLVEQYFDSTWMHDSRVQLIVEDGRNYVTHTADTYDIISIEVGQIYRPRVASFYTWDFYEQIRSRLRPGGLVCQFVPIEFLGPAEFRTMVRTFLQVFPQSILWYNTSELLLLGSSDTSRQFDPERFQAFLDSHPQLKQELDYAYWDGPSRYLSRPEVFLAGFLAGPQELQAMSEGGSVYRDERPYLEYLPLTGRGATSEMIALLRQHLAPLTQITAADSDQLLADSRTIRQQNLGAVLARLAANRGQAYESAGMLTEAALEYQQALAEMPEYPRANLRLAELLQSQQRMGEAVPFLRRVLAADPHDLSTMFQLASALAAVGDQPGAKKLFAQLLEQRPEHAQANLRLGMLLQADGQLSEAIDCFRRSLQANPHLVEAHLGWAGTLILQQQLDDAIEHYQLAAKLSPQDADIQVKLGWAWAMAGKHQQAQECFQAALRLQPGAARAHLGMGNVLLSTGELEQAAQAYRRALALDPQLAEAHIALAFLLQNADQLTPALQHLQSALREVPNDPAALTGAAWILATHSDAAQRNPQQAITLAQRAWQVTGRQDPQAGQVLAAAYAAAGQFDVAIDVAQQAHALAQQLSIDPLARQLQQQLERYRQGKPCVD